MKDQIYKILRNKLYKIRDYLFDLEDRTPLIGIPLVYSYYFLYLIKWKIDLKILELKTRLKYGKLDFNKICWVNPQKIKYYISDHKYNKWNINSRILNGDWDRSEKRFEDIGIVKAIEQRFKGGKKWEEIEFYHQVLDLFSQGITWRYKNKEHWDNDLKGIDSLYHRIKNIGYQSTNELYSNNKFYGKVENLRINRKVLDDVTLAISRDGHFLFVNGRHRLKIAQLLNISRISSVIVLRHEKWMKFRKNLIEFSKKYQGGKLYYQLTHPDLQDIPFKFRDRCFNLIKENLSISKGSLLEIGENLGYFCHKFEDEGFNCFTAEGNQRRIHFLKKLKKAEQKKFKIIPEYIFDYNKNQELNFDIALILNLFHYFFEEMNSQMNLDEFLKRLKVKELFVGVPNFKKNRNRKLYRNCNLDQFINFIIKNSCLNKVEYIGRIEEDQLLYKFMFNNV